MYLIMLIHHIIHLSICIPTIVPDLKVDYVLNSIPESVVITQLPV